MQPPEAQPPARQRWRAFAAYAVAAAVSVIAAIVLLRLRGADLHIPFDYGGDLFLGAMVVKSILEEGWYLTNPHLGAPGVLTMHDFPMADLVHNLVFKGLGLFSHDWPLVLNLHFLAGFPLITMSALAVFRYFRVSYAPALAASVLYAFLPSRVLKGEGHFELGMFYQVPLMILVALWVCGDAPPLVRDRGPGRWPGLELRRRRSLAAIAIGLLTAGTGLYLAFFGTALTVLGGVWASLRRRTPRHALAGLLVGAVIVGWLAAQAVPTLLYQHRNGPNDQVAHRSPHEAEFYGLKITQLLLPTTGHRIPALRNFKARYDAMTVPPGGESAVISLGVVGAVGFLSLLAILLLGPRNDRPRDDVLFPLAVLNLLAVLIGTLGGFGALFAFLVTPQIRTYCRIGIVIGFFALFAAALLIERIGAERKALTGALAALALCLGLFDQVSRAAIRPYRDVAAAYKADARLVAAIEAAVPPNAMIFQLPYQRFPEAVLPPGTRMLNYDQLRFYLHSRSVRWSYPTMADRTGDAWTSSVADQEPARMVETLADAELAAILIDRRGYPDDGAAIELGLARVLGAPRLVSDDRRYVLFDLAPPQRAASASRSADERARRRDAALHLVHARWASGFFGEEKDSSGLFHWSSGTSELEINNTWGVPRRLAITTTFSAAQPPAVVTIRGALLAEPIEIPPEGLHFSRTLTVPPGRHVIHFVGKGRPAIAPSDPRTLVWRMYNTEFRDLDAAPDGGR